MGRQITCYRVLVRDIKGQLWAPIIVAASEFEARAKAENLYAEAVIALPMH